MIHGFERLTSGFYHSLGDELGMICFAEIKSTNLFHIAFRPQLWSFILLPLHAFVCDVGSNQQLIYLQDTTENGEIIYEPLKNILEDDPVTLAKYAKDHNLLNVEGWKRLKPLARREKKLNRLINQV